MNEKEARGVSPFNNELKWHKAQGYLESIEKAKVLWEALMDIGVNPDHKCKCQCANHRVEHAQVALAQWEKEK